YPVYRTHHNLARILKTVSTTPGSFACTLLGEEILDWMQRLTFPDERIQPLVRGVTRIHVIEEARHVRYAREELRRLMLTKGKGKERGGFISYAQLGINQLGAVYEGLMSYTGFIADEDLWEVAKAGDPSGGSWMIKASQVQDYPDEVFVRRVNDETGAAERVVHSRGKFVYRLAGRDRQTSASYYTPKSLTEVTVELA
ncbi:diiron oxygenase, partial [Streptomyces sp. SID12501]|uniref:diiron oxygenase n=1 Tax=Streptomyces sp. SID12501 TaxID=2706042 RepID=UPI001EF2B29A